jgi:hypothetical protein
MTETVYKRSNRSSIGVINDENFFQSKSKFTRIFKPHSMELKPLVAEWSASIGGWTPG